MSMFVIFCFQICRWSDEKNTLLTFKILKILNHLRGERSYQVWSSGPVLLREGHSSPWSPSYLQLWVLGDDQNWDEQDCRNKQLKMFFLFRATRHTQRDRVRSSVTQEELGVQPTFLQDGGIWFGWPPSAFQESCSVPTMRRPPGRT